MIAKVRGRDWTKVSGLERGSEEGNWREPRGWSKQA